MASNRLPAFEEIRPVRSVADVRAMQAELEQLERESPDHPELEEKRRLLRLAFSELWSGGTAMNGPTKPHEYLSTACHHGIHSRCRGTCKFCSAQCKCPCHQKQEQ